MSSGTRLSQRLAPLLSGLRLLVIDSDRATADLLCEAIGGVEVKIPVRRPPKTRTVSPAAVPGADSKPQVHRATGTAEARVLLERLAARGEAIDLIVAPEPADDAAAAALAEAAALHPEARLVLTSATPTLNGALAAIRRGALDYLDLPSLGREQLASRLIYAVGRRHLQVRGERRLDRLKSAVRQLNRARHTVGRKVDLLCTDLVDAYGEVARRVEQVRVIEHLRKLLGGAGDLEQLLCHTMDWLLRELGHCNIAIYLTDDSGASELGAYMKHSVAGDRPLTDWLARHIVPRTTAPESPDGFFHGGEEAWGAQVKSQRTAALLGHTLMAVDCNYLAESLGTLIVFRRAERPFAAGETELLKAAAAPFAIALTNLVRGAGGEADEASGEGSGGDSKGRRSKRRRNEDDADWWKHGRPRPE